MPGEFRKENQFVVSPRSGNLSNLKFERIVTDTIRTIAKQMRKQGACRIVIKLDFFADILRLSFLLERV